MNEVLTQERLSHATRSLALERAGELKKGEHLVLPSDLADMKIDFISLNLTVGTDAAHDGGVIITVHHQPSSFEKRNEVLVETLDLHPDGTATARASQVAPGRLTIPVRLQDILVDEKLLIRFRSLLEYGLPESYSADDRIREQTEFEICDACWLFGGAYLRREMDGGAIYIKPISKTSKIDRLVVYDYLTHQKYVLVAGTTNHELDYVEPLKQENGRWIDQMVINHYRDLHKPNSADKQRIRELMVEALYSTHTRPDKEAIKLIGDTFNFLALENIL